MNLHRDDMSLAEYRLRKVLFIDKHQIELKRMLLLTAIFFVFMLVLSINRYPAFASSDQGLFNQIFWNNLQGRFFQSSLSGANSFAAMANGEPPSVSSNHLGQHFVPDFLLWLPFYALFPSAVTLTLLQVSLVTAGGLALYALARHYLQPNLSLMITVGYYTANAVVGPTFDNFYEQCQIPLFVFGLLLAMEKRRWSIFWLLVIVTLGIREDTGLILFGIGLYLLVSWRHPRIGIVLCLLSFAYITVVTSVVMPQFSDDNSRLYLSTRFQQFVNGDSSPSTLQVLWGMLTHPVELLTSLWTPLETKFFYLFKQWVPLAFIPAVSGAAWALTMIPLLALFAQASDRAIDINIRYAVAVVPGLFYGAILWWSYHPKEFTAKVRRFWISCITLSVVLIVSAKPNGAFYFLSPKSVLSQSRVPIARQWEHASHAQKVMQLIPPDATVSATTYLVPHLSSRRAIVDQRFTKLKNDQGQVVEIDYLIADFWRLQNPKGLSKYERLLLKSSLHSVDDRIANATYGLLDLNDGIVLLQRGVPSTAQAMDDWKQFRKQLASHDQGKRQSSTVRD